VARGQGTTMKRCGCRDPRTGRQYGTRCPRLRKRGHGSWYINLPTTPTFSSPAGRLRRGGYHSRADARQALSRLGGPAQQRRTHPLTVNDWFDRWEADIERRLRPSTVLGYRRHLELYLRPLLGHEILSELTPDDVQGAFDTIIRQHHREDLPLTAATMQRIKDTLSPALNCALRAQLLTDNPCRHINLPPAQRSRPVVWTAAMVQHWRRTGQHPVLGVWTAEMTAQFLEHIRDHQDYALFHVYALRGLRRGEGLGIRWSDVSFTRKTVTINRQLQKLPGQPLQAVDPKTPSSVRIVALDNNTLRVLRIHRAQQARDAEAAGEHWTESGYIFTDRTGQPLAPDHASSTFRSLIKKHDLPPVRLHDLRHGSASLGLAAGVALKTVSDQHGHRTVMTTADTYQSVLSREANSAAEAVALLVRQAGRRIARRTAKQARRNEVRRNDRKSKRLGLENCSSG